MFKQDLFKDKKILVTGGRSGIGYTIASQFLALGAQVMIASRNTEKMTIAHEALSKLGPCYSFACDIRETDQVEALAKAIDKEMGGLDILINNAGGQFPSAAENISYNGWNAVVNNNLNGTWFVTQNMAKQFFLPQQKGVIINIIADIYKGFPGMAHTGAARAGVENLTKTLSIEWVNKNIRVNAIAPGIINSSGMENYPPEFLKGINDKIPMKKMGTTEDVAYSALFLSSPMASYITGETLYVDGGNRLWGDMWEIPS